MSGAVYPVPGADAFYDLGTTNTSFIKMSKILRDLGVKNNKFFLVLLDKGLSSINPHDVKLSPELRLRVAAETAANPWYFLREVVRIPVPGGKKPYELHRGNLALTWCLANNLNAVMELPRQNFKTISACCWYAWVYDFGASNSQLTFGNKELKDAELNLKRLKDIRDAYPDYLKFDTKDDVNNIQSILSAKNGNFIKVMSAPQNHESADKQGRGTSTPIVWWDEMAFLRYNWVVYGSASPAQSQSMLEAKANGKPYSKLITTTPSQLELPQSKFVRDMMDNGCRFSEEMYDMTPDQAREYVGRNSDNDFVYIKFSYREIGRDEDWFRQQCRSLNNDQLLVKREILLEWTYSSDVSPFSEEQLDRVAPYVRNEPEGRLMLAQYYPLTILEAPTRWDLPFVVGVDVAGGLSRDASAIEVLHPSDLRAIMSFRNNRIDTKELFLVLCDLLSKMPNAICVVERNSIGKGVLDHLKDTPFERQLYYEYRRQEAVKKIQPVKGPPRGQGPLVKVYGVATTAESRSRMVDDILHTVVEQQPEAIQCPLLFRDIKNLERKNNGKIEHRDGEGDDNLFAFLVARYAAAYGKNFSKLNRWPSGSEAPEGVRTAGENATALKRLSLATSNKPSGVSEVWIRAALQAEKERAAAPKSSRAAAIERIAGLNRPARTEGESR